MSCYDEMWRLPRLTVARAALTIALAILLSEIAETATHTIMFLNGG